MSDLDAAQTVDDLGPLDRRGFLKSLGGGLLILLAVDQEALTQESGHAAPQDIAAWLHMDQNGTVTAFTGKVEVGQNARTSLTQAVADELRIPPDSIRLVMGDTALTPWDAGTFGSRTTPTMAPQIRKMAACMREQLVRVAAERWKIEPAALLADDGSILHSRSGRKASYAELAGTVDWKKVLASENGITPPARWQYGGKSISKIGANQIVTGSHKYASDIKRPGMLFGRVLRPPSFGAKLQSLDTSAATRMRGAHIVREGDLVGVVAETELVAEKAVAAIQARWQEQPQISEKELFSYLKSNVEESGEAEAAAPHPATASGKTLESTYTVAYIAHVPLEPRAAVAEWQGSKLTVWTGTQRPFGVREELAEALRLPEESVRVIVPDTGSAYGGKHSGECAIEAARLAKAAARPVKLIWTREEEFTWAYFRPAGVIEVRSSVSPDGALTFWDFHNYNSGPSGLKTPYRCANSQAHFHSTKYPLRQGSYRGLAATANHFARECHIDELAALAGIDPLSFRLKNLQEGRVRAVLEAATGQFEWGKNRPPSGHGYGIACGLEKGSVFATCAHISVSPDRQIQIERVVEAFECGAIVNPEHLKNQVEGAVVMGLGGALFEAIHFANGRVLNPHLAQYRVPRFGEAPSIEVVLVDRPDLPSAGAGETPIMGIAPAIGNALFQATGIRVRSMPIQPAFQSIRS